MSNSLTDRLAALTQAYIRQLADRVIELDNAYQRFLDDPGIDANAETLRLVAHKIAGSGATFGFDGITDAGRSLEHAIGAMLAGNGGREAATLEEVGSLCESLKAHCRQESKVAGSVFSHSRDDKAGSKPSERDLRQIVVASLEQSSEIVEIGDQLGFFGYEVNYVSTLHALRLFAESNPTGVAVVHTDFVLGRSGGPEELEAIQSEVKHEFHYIFVSNRTDYHARLSALRSGAEAYFLLPLEITKLLDSLEELAGRTEAEPYHVLIVDDDPEQVSYYALILQQSGMITSVASDPKTVLDLLAESKPELILMDMYMPGCTGNELLSIIRQQEVFVSIPVVFLSVEGDEERQLQAIRKGADGFITKPADPEYLVATVTNRLSRTRSIRYFMERDSLTGLLNHTNLREQLLRELLRSERASVELCFAMIDLDHFKEVNDTHGHLTGDKVLKSLSRILMERLRRTDIIGRYGGEEFGVVLSNTDEARAVTILDEIRTNFGKVRHQGERSSFYVTFSCGVAGFPSYVDVDSLTAAADEALYRAKEGGRNRVEAATASAT